MYNNISAAAATAAAVDNINSAVHTSISRTSRQHVRTTPLAAGIKQFPRTRAVKKACYARKISRQKI
jgi:hypothetical protein